MENKTPQNLKQGDQCLVIGGTNVGKSGKVRDINTSKTGHITITVEQKTQLGSKHLERMLSSRMRKKRSNRRTDYSAFFMKISKI